MRLTFTHLTGSLLLLLGLSSFAYAQMATVQGQITDPRDEAVPGITVMLNDSRGVATDVSGNFTISNICGRKTTSWAFSGTCSTCTSFFSTGPAWASAAAKPLFLRN